jgi:hypothetical protein
MVRRSIGWNMLPTNNIGGEGSRARNVYRLNSAFRFARVLECPARRHLHG